MTMRKKYLLIILASLGVSVTATRADPNQKSWSGDLTPIAQSEWNKKTAAHLLERAGFGGTREQIAEFAKLSPVEAVRRLVYFDGAPKGTPPPFDHSGVHDAGLEPFPPSRPATTKLASEKGEALGVKVKPSGNRRLQPVVDRFFYWLRASSLENQPRRLLVGQSDAGFTTPAARKNGALLAWPLCRQ